MKVNLNSRLTILNSVKPQTVLNLPQASSNPSSDASLDSVKMNSIAPNIFNFPGSGLIKNTFKWFFIPFVLFLTFLKIFKDELQTLFDWIVRFFNSFFD